MSGHLHPFFIHDQWISCNGVAAIEEDCAATFKSMLKAGKETLAVSEHWDFHILFWKVSVAML